MNPRWLRALQQMQQQAGRMQNLLNDLLLLAKLEATECSDRLPVAVDTLLASIRGIAPGPVRRAQHRISLDATPAVQLKGSEAELRSAFYQPGIQRGEVHPRRGRIRIRWWADEQGAHLSVQDFSIGVDPKHLPRLTERFYQVDLQPRLEHRRHRPRPGHRQAC